MRDIAGGSDARSVEKTLAYARMVFGRDYRLNVCMEEPAELIKAISKLIRRDCFERTFDNEEAFNNVLEEMADVEIIIAELQGILGISDTTLMAEVKRKLDILSRKTDKEVLSFNGWNDPEHHE